MLQLAGSGRAFCSQPGILHPLPCSRLTSNPAQIIVHEACHEANAGPWYRAAERSGATVRVWRVDPATCETRLEHLRALVGPATRLVAVVHVSNILGEVRRAKPLADLPQMSGKSAVDVLTIRRYPESEERH